MRGAVLYRPPATVWVSLALVTPLEYWAIVSSTAVHRGDKAPRFEPVRNRD